MGGLTIAPVLPSALLTRRFYVRQSFRRAGIGRSIAAMLLDRAFKTTTATASRSGSRFGKEV